MTTSEHGTLEGPSGHHAARDALVVVPRQLHAGPELRDKRVAVAGLRGRHDVHLFPHTQIER